MSALLDVELMATQRPLDYDHDATVAVQASVSAHRRTEWTPTAAKQSARRSNKAVQILDRLRQGPATTWELAQITVAFSQRMGDLKKLGHRIEREDFVEAGAEWSVYRLEGVAEHSQREGR